MAGRHLKLILRDVLGQGEDRLDGGPKLPLGGGAHWLAIGRISNLEDGQRQGWVWERPAGIGHSGT